MANHSILYAVENALVGFYQSASISSSLANINIYAGMSNEEKEAPALICHAPTAAQATMQGLYVWNVKADIVLKTMASDNEIAAVDTLADSIFETICDPNTITTLGSYSDSLTVYDLTVENISNDFDGDAWINSISLNIIAVNNS